MSAARNGALRSALRSAGWLASEKLLRMVLALVVGVWVARHLGPAEFGRLNLALTWVGLLGSFAWLGVGDAMTRELVRDRSKEGLLLGSALLLRLIGCVLSLLCIYAAFRLGLIGAEIGGLVAVLCWMLPASELTGGLWMWFQSHLRMGRVVMAKNAGLLIGSAARVGVILAGGGALAMAWTFLGEALVVGLGVLLVYSLHGAGFRHWRFDARHAWGFFLQGVPILLSAMVVTLNARLDQLMIGWLSGVSEVGLYAAATRFSEIWWLVPTLLMQSLAPRFMFAADLRPARLQRNVAWMLVGLALLALLPCLALSLGSEAVTALLLGEAYRGSAAVLTVHVWLAVFVFVDAAQNQFLLATGRQRTLLHKSLWALAINLLGNLLLVPSLGAVGAALATLTAQASTAIAYYYVDRSQAPVRAVHRRSLRVLQRAPRLLHRLRTMRRT